METIADFAVEPFTPNIYANISKCLKLFNCFQHYISRLVLTLNANWKKNKDFSRT